MAREIRNFTVSVPIGTTIAAPQVTALTMPARQVRGIRVRVPPGPRGAVGFALGASGVAVLPWGPGEWMVADDEAIEWPLDGQITSGAWQLRAYNLGDYPHTLYVTFQLDPLPSVENGQLLSAPLDLTA